MRLDRYKRNRRVYKCQTFGTLHTSFLESNIFDLVNPELLTCDIELEIVFLFYC
jgi:hypothetical protein